MDVRGARAQHLQAEVSLLAGVPFGGPPAFLVPHADDSNDGLSAHFNGPRAVAISPENTYALIADTTLASGDVASAVPLYQTSLVLLTSAAGGVFFREFAAMGPPQAIGYTCGIALCLLGLGVLGHAHATEAVEQGERLSTLGEKSPEPPTPLAARLSMADRTAPSRWVATDRRMSVAQIAGSGVVGFGLFAANEMQSPPGLGRQRSMTLPARRVRESDGLLSGDLFGGRSRARTPPPSSTNSHSPGASRHLNSAFFLKPFTSSTTIRELEEREIFL